MVIALRSKKKLGRKNTKCLQREDGVSGLVRTQRVFTYIRIYIGFKMCEDFFAGGGGSGGVCVCVCVCVCVLVCIRRAFFFSTWTRAAYKVVCMRMYVLYIHMRMYVYTYVCMRMYVYTYVCVCMYVCMRMYVCMYAYVCIYVCVCMYEFMKSFRA